MENLPKDPYILLSWVNMKLRDEYESLDELCRSLDIDETELVDALHAAGFDYLPEQNRFA